MTGQPDTTAGQSSPNRVQQRPTVSVVIIFLDAARFLEEAIESVLAQQYEDWELLLIDDGSTDASGAIARRCARRKPNQIRYLTHPAHENRGMSASRNLGIREARGEYVAFLDADDVWLPGKLERQVAILASYPSAMMLYGQTLRWYSWDPESDGRDEPRSLPFEGDRVVDSPYLLRWLLQRQAIPAIDSVLARRDAVLAVGGFEDEFRGMYEDQAFYVKMFLRYPVFVSSECWDRYRKHDDSECAAVVRRGELDETRRRFLSFVERYLTSQRCRDAVAWRLLRQEWRALGRGSHPPARHGLAQLGELGYRLAQARLATAAANRTRAAAKAARTVATVHRRLTPRTLDHVRRNDAETLVRIPTQLIVDEYGFSLAPRGWHYLRSLLEDYDRRTGLDLGDTTYFRFFTHPELRSVKYLDDVLFLHRPEERSRPGFRFFFGTYPWGDWTESDARVGGKRFGHHYDAVEGRETRDLYGYRRNPWYELGDPYPLQLEWRRTLELYRSIRGGYRPNRYPSLPSVVLLVRSDGAFRAVRYKGHHRLAILAHLGHEVATVAVRPESVRLVAEAEVEQWYYVRHGLCSPERALTIFHAFFELDGRERIEHLGLAPSSSATPTDVVTSTPAGAASVPFVADERVQRRRL
jgi:glycosyltransferase involved in cell wall biosynthesis